MYDLQQSKTVDDEDVDDSDNDDNNNNEGNDWSCTVSTEIIVVAVVLSKILRFPNASTRRQRIAALVLLPVAFPA